MTIDANNGTIHEIFTTVKPIIEKIDQKLKKKDNVIHICNSTYNTLIHLLYISLSSQLNFFLLVNSYFFFCMC